MADEGMSGTAALTVGDGKGMVVMEMEGMIRSHLASINRLEDELSKYKDLLDNIFQNDPTYKKHDEAAKEASKIRSNTKQQILKQPQAADLSQKIKDGRDQLKELKEALSDYLREYNRLSGLTEIEDESGEVRQIIYVAKLVKKAPGFE